MDDQNIQKSKDWFQNNLVKAKEWTQGSRVKFQEWVNSSSAKRNWCFFIGLALFVLGIWMFIVFSDGEFPWPWKNYQGQFIFPWMDKSEAGITIFCDDGGLHFGTDWIKNFLGASPSSENRK